MNLLNTDNRFAYDIRHIIDNIPKAITTQNRFANRVSSFKAPKVLQQLWKNAVCHRHVDVKYDGTFFSSLAIPYRGLCTVYVDSHKRIVVSSLRQIHNTTFKW